MQSNVAVRTIRVSPKVARAIAARRLHPRETYDQVLERLLEDVTELNEQTKRDIRKAVREIKTGRYKTHDQVRAELGL